MTGTRRNKWRPGSDVRRGRAGKLHPDRDSWAVAKNCEVICYVGEPGPQSIEQFRLDDDTDPGESVRLVIRTAGRKSLFLNLTALTHEELEAVKSIIDRAFEAADPTCKLRDEVAHDAYERGDDSFERVYRAVPRVVIRPRPERQYTPGVPERPDAPDDVEHGEQGRDDHPPGSAQDGPDA